MNQVKRPIIGVALMLGAMAVLPGIDVIAKFLGQQGMPILQVVWARLVLGALMTLPFALRIAGPKALWPDRPWYHTLRAAFLVAATFFFFLSLKWLPIADALAIFFVQPLIVTVLSAFVLREAVGPRRWIAVAVGFIGTLIIIRPGIAELNPGSWLALAAGVTLAFYFVMTRAISGRAHAMVTMFQTSLLGGLILSAGIWWVWVWPSPTQWAMLAALAFIGTAGHLMIVRAGVVVLQRFPRCLHLPWRGDPDFLRDLHLDARTCQRPSPRTKSAGATLKPYTGWLLPVFGQPILHPGDLSLLCGDHGFGQLAHLGVLAMFQHDARHVDRALMMRDHAPDKVNVSVPGEGNGHAFVHRGIGLHEGHGRGRLAPGHLMPGMGVDDGFCKG
jgi:drug/metabolite transporter (DMT)-like permease